MHAVRHRCLGVIKIILFTCCRKCVEFYEIFMQVTQWRLLILEIQRTCSFCVHSLPLWSSFTHSIPPPPPPPPCGTDSDEGSEGTLKKSAVVSVIRERNSFGFTISGRYSRSFVTTISTISHNVLTFSALHVQLNKVSFETRLNMKLLAFCMCCLVF